MTDLEIPLSKNRHGHYRFFEILPGSLSILMLAMPFILSLFSATLAAFFVLLYLLTYLTRALALAFRSLHGFRALRLNQKFNWRELTNELDTGKIGESAGKRPTWHINQVNRCSGDNLEIKPSELLHAVIIATVNESREILEPTIKSLLASNYNMKQVIMIIAYEGRAGEEAAKRAKSLVEEYKSELFHAEAVMHPFGLPDEIIGKGGNINCAARWLEGYLEDKRIDPLRVIVTTLDADNRPDKEYLPCLSYAYSICHDKVRAAFQPVSMYTNNIWDAPAPMRVLATGNSVFHIVQSMRPHIMRNFSSHAQGMASLIETNFWSARTIVEDGHQFWRSYFRFDGNYRVYPLHVPIYQDAVLTDSYKKTLKAQFVQLRRWTYGASDIAYVADKGFFRKNRVPKLDLLAKLLRLIEGHVTWAVGPILILVSGFIPGFFNPQNIAANQLPVIVSRVQTVALIGAVATVYLCLKTLPPKPERYKRRRTLWMVLQWIYLPVTTIVYNSFAAIYSQTRLMFGWYMDKFDVTEKAAVSSEIKD